MLASGNGAEGQQHPALSAATAPDAGGGTIVLVPDASNVVILPDGATLDNLVVRGRDLVIETADGRVYVIPDGAVFVPQIVAQGVAVPPLNLAALLIGHEPQPAAGPVQSSGNNFASDVAPLQDAYNLGNLLPYTELSFAQPNSVEIFPGRINRPVTLTLTPDSPSVDEAGLPARGAEPAGSNSAANSETTTGLIHVDAPDGLASITINGVAVTAVGQTIATPRGTLTITSIAGGDIGYSYTLADNTSGDNTTDTFTVVGTDTDGDTATGIVTIRIVDDVPTARADTDAVAAGTYGPESGNVLTGAGTTSGAAGADTQGADGATVTGFRGGTTGNFAAAGTTVAGTYGTLTFNANGTYTYTRNAGTPGGVSDVFSYQITDGDGDTSTATLTIAIGDAIPRAGENATVLLDDDALAGGNPGGTGDTVNAQNTTGTLAASGGDGPLTWALATTGAPAGFSYVANGTGLDVFQGATKVMTIALNSATGAYTVTQVAPIVHAAGGDENNQAFTINYTATDKDGDAANGSLAISVNDDTPTATNDSAAIASGTYGPVTGNVYTNDSIGADGAATGGPVTAITGFGGAGTVGGTTTGHYGTLTLNADGTYSYTRSAGTPGGVSDTFTYTITDKDGDTTTATLTIDIADARPMTGENALVQVDDDALAGGNPGGVGDGPDAVNTTGFFSASGGDGPLTWSMVAYAPSLGMSAALINSGLVEIYQGATKIATIQLNNATGAYIITQTAPVQHAAGPNGEDNGNFILQYRVTDQDGDAAFGLITIQFNDDTPVVVADTDAVTEDGPLIAIGNVMTGAGSDGNVAGADSIGADGAIAGGPVTAVAFGATAGTVGSALNGAHGTLTLNADGSYSYALDNADPAVQALDDGETLTEVFTYTITDKDGDTATTSLTITINGHNDAPVVRAGTTAVSEEGLAGGNPDATGATDTTDSATATGTIVASDVDVEPLTFTLGTPATALTSGGVPITWSGAGTGTLVGKAGAATVITVTIDSAGNYTVTLSGPVDHPTTGAEDSLNLVIPVNVSDGTASTPTTLTVSIEDDSPIALNDTDTVAAGTYGPETGNVLSGTGTTSGAAGADSIGADGAAASGAVSAITGSGGAGTIGGTTTGAYGTLTMNADGSYSYVRNAGTPGGVNDTFTYTITDRDGDTATATLTITIADARPVTAANGVVQLDDDALAGGNPGGVGDVTPDTANTSGTLAGSGGDGPLTWSAISYVPTVGLSATLVNPGLINIYQGATLVATITINNATGAYVVTQLAPIMHAAGSDENNATFQLNYRVTDQDGDFASGSLNINFNDDTPIATNDTNALLAGATTATGNVYANDSIGADGPTTPGAVTAVESVNVPANTDNTLDGSNNLVVAGQYGTLTLNADGSYSYARSNSAPVSGVDTFTYTITDSDGDTATATLTFTIADAGPITGANAAVQLDDDALAGGNPGGVGDVTPDTANTSGTLAGSGGDGPLTWSAISYVPTVGLSATLVNPGLINIYQGATLVATITINNATGAYVVTQLAPIMHAAGSDENNATFQLNYRVTDQDGDFASGSLNINFNDDTPIATNDVNSILSGSNTPITGNVYANDSIGADGPAASGPVTAITGFGGAGTVGGSTVGHYGTLVLNANGTYTYTRSAGTPGNVTDTFTYTITDQDGDSTTATLTITIEDAVPIVGANAQVLLDDDALAGGNAGGVGDTVNAQNTSGTLSGSGGDGALTWAFQTTGFPAGFTYTANGTGLDVFQGATKVMTITLNPANGAYTVTQVAPIVHAAGADENNQAFTINYTVTDADGDATPGTLSISVNDDTPTATSDTGSLAAGAYGPVTGNVYTNDSIGADGAAAGGPVTAITGFGGAGTVGGTTTGHYGTLTLNANGTYSYTRSAGTPGGVSDTFTYTITDKDGDSTTATLTINIADALPVTAANAAVQLDDDALAGGNPGGVGDVTPDTANTSGTLAGSGGDGPLTWSAISYVPTAGLSATLVNPGLINISQGATLVATITINNATGAYVVTQLAPIMHTAGGDENNATFQLNYRVTDQDGDFASGSLNINFNDDTPTAVNDTASLGVGAFGPITGNVYTNDSIGADGAATGGPVTAITGFNNVAGTVGGTTSGHYGTLTLNADGTYSYTRSAGTPGGVSDTFTYTITDKDGDSTTATLTINIADAAPQTAANATVQLDDETLAGGIAGGTGDVSPDTANTSGTLAASGGDGALTWAFLTTGFPAGFTYTANGTGLDVYQGTTKVIAITLNAATGAYTVTQVAPVMHTAGGNENNQAFTINYTATDADGDAAAGTLAITVNDDSPIAVVPTAITLTNTAGAPVFASLDPNLLDNYGADGGHVRFSPTLDGTNSGLTSNLTPITYHVSADGFTLTGTAGATTIFTITLLPGTNEYSVDMDGIVDSLTTLNFASGAYQFVGGNTAWVGFVPTGQNTTTLTVNDNSKDLLVTPSISGADNGTINGSSVALGVGSGNAVDAGEMVRLDFVTDLVGDTAGPGGYSVAGNRDHSFDGHYSTNGASALITASSGSTVRFTAKDDFDTDLVVGNGTVDTITKIVIAYNGVPSSFITANGSYTVNGVTFTVTFNGDGSVSVANVQGTSGAGAIGTQVAVYTADGYSSLEIAHQAGSNFKLGNFGTVIQNTNPVNFTVPVEVIDNDGDVSPSANLSITLNPAAPPIALDLNGDGVHFLAASAGVTFDYAGNGSLVHTAWVDKNDGLLAIDLNHNGRVDNGSEIVFAGNGQTDLQGLAAQYDSNGDGQLTAADAAFARFGVWQDANSNGVSDPGEFKTLAEMGITSISLKGDGVAYSAANGDVMVAGSTTYTKADGSTGIVADVSLATTELQRQSTQPAELAAINAAATGLLAAMAIEQANSGNWGQPQASAHNLALAPVAVAIEPDSQVPGSTPIEPVRVAEASFAGSALPESGHAGFTESFHDRIDAVQMTADDNGAAIVADLGQKSSLFDFSDSSHGVMDALLSVGGPVPVQAIATTQALPVVAEALSDAAGNHLVDGIVGHFADGSAPQLGATSGGDFAIQGLLDSGVHGSGADLTHIYMMPTLDHDQLATVA